MKFAQESPAAVLAFLPGTSGVKLTLDYSHFIYQGHAQAQNVLQARRADEEDAAYMTGSILRIDGGILLPYKGD